MKKTITVSAKETSIALAIGKEAQTCPECGAEGETLGRIRSYTFDICRYECKCGCCWEIDSAELKAEIQRRRRAYETD